MKGSLLWLPFVFLGLKLRIIRTSSV